MAVRSRAGLDIVSHPTRPKDWIPCALGAYLDGWFFHPLLFHIPMVRHRYICYDAAGSTKTIAPFVVHSSYGCVINSLVHQFASKHGELANHEGLAEIPAT